MMAKSFENATGTIFLRDDGIVHVKIKEGIDASVSDAKDFLAQKRQWSKEKLGLIIDRQEAYSAAIDIFRDGMPDIDAEFTAIAYVVYSKFGKIASEEVISYQLGTVPTKIFHNLDEAVSWLKKMQSQ